VRKRSAYRPRAVLANPVAYVIESMAPVAHYDSYLVELKIKNHAALVALTQGRAQRCDMAVLTAMSNMVEALLSLGFGEEYTDVMAAGRQAMIDVCRRGLQTGRFILRAPEMTALNSLIELHDAQMEVITVKDVERGLAAIHKRERSGRVERIAV
jgi:hypothetical protein